MRPLLLQLMENVETRFEQVRKNGPMQEEEFQLFILMTLMETLGELGEK